MQLYTALSEAPDPFPLLEASIESLVVSEDTVPRLTSENEELQRRVAKLSSQLENTEERLQAESRAKKELEENASAKAGEIETSWAKALEEKEMNWSAKEKAFEEKLENQDRLLKELKANYEVSQKLGQTEQEAAVEKAASAELRLVSSDLEKTSARLSEMEARNEQLRVELARASSQANHSREDDGSLLRLQTENSGLMRKLDSSRFEREAEKRDWESRLRQLERQQTSAVEDNQQLRAKMKKYSDYEELKRELTMLKSIELEADDEGDEENVAANGSVHDGKKESLEQLLLARNKKLSNDLTLLRVSHQELTQQLDELREELSRTNAELEKSQKLSATLENDLMQVQEEAANAMPSSGMSVAGTYTSRYPQSSRRGRASPTSSIISGYDSPNRSSSTTLEALRSGEPVGGGSGILPMIQAQRDRFKQKNQQLETELQKTYASVTALRQEVASLQKDNLNLYEKTRYVSAYSRSGASSSAYGQGPSHTAVHTSDDAIGDRWKSQYEANISPFAAFRGREAARAYKRMSLPERMIFSLTRIVLATRTSRNLFASYCLALHLLVFIMLYWMSTASSGAHHIGEASAAAAVVGNSFKNTDSHAADWHQEDFG